MAAGVLFDKLLQAYRPGTSPSLNCCNIQNQPFPSVQILRP